MREHRFRNRVAEGSLTLPVMSVITFVCWLLATSPFDAASWLTLAMVVLQTYVFVECNNQCQLLRIRSRMVSASFLAFVSAVPALHASTWHWLPAVSLLLSYFVAFKGYGRFQPQGWVFHAFLFLSIGSVVFPPMLLLVPFLLFSCSRQLRILTGKAFVAALLGLLFPYWVYGAFCLLTGFDVPRLLLAWQQALRPSPPLLAGFELWQLAFLPFLLFLVLLSMAHFVRTSYNDKIRTRQYFYTLFSLQLPLFFLLLWYPEAFTFTLPLFLTTSVPFIAHYFALARGRFMNGWFIVCLLLLIALAVPSYLGLWPLLPSGLSALPTKFLH